MKRSSCVCHITKDQITSNDIQILVYMHIKHWEILNCNLIFITLHYIERKWLFLMCKLMFLLTRPIEFNTRRSVRVCFNPQDIFILPFCHQNYNFFFQLLLCQINKVRELLAFICVKVSQKSHVNSTTHNKVS